MGKRGPAKGSGGRPKIKIDWAAFETACKLIAPKTEICNLLGCDDMTLLRQVKEKYGETFETVLKRLSEGTKMSLRRFQFQQAENTDSLIAFMGQETAFRVNALSETEVF